MTRGGKGATRNRLAIRLPGRAPRESGVSWFQSHAGHGARDSNTTGNMIIVLSAGARRRSHGVADDGEGKRGAPTWGCRGRQSIGRGRARTTPGSLRRDQSPIASDRRRARTGDRVDASARRFARRSDEGPLRAVISFHQRSPRLGAKFFFTTCTAVRASD